MRLHRSTHPHDLAPGDQRSASFDWTGFVVEEIDDAADPAFARVYDALASIFLPLGEMETSVILRQRLGLKNLPERSGYRFCHRMMAIEKDGQVAAARDHTTIISIQPSPAIYVHLSHAYVAPAWRRSGLAGWLRAFPLADARKFREEAELPATVPITLVAEMEPLQSAEQLPRLAAYARAGFRRVDPNLVQYFQPDFRSPDEIDASGGPQPLPFWLMLRQVGLEDQNVIYGAELQRLVRAIYALYGAGFRAADMLALYRQFDDYPSAETILALERFDAADKK